MKRIDLLLILLLLYPFSSNAYSHLSPYSFCGGDRVNCVDPTGCVIEGVTKKDAAMAVEDFRAMLDTGLQLDYYRHYICYEFGISNIVTVCIAEGDSICDVFICNEQERIVSTTCPKTPLLKWAFNIMPIESSNTSPIRDNDYKPYYYKLSLIYCGRQMILSSTLPFYNHIDVGETQIEDLKSFMIQLWYSNCIINSDNGSNALINVKQPRHFQHVEPIRTENLILRVMGIPFINTGIDHGPRTLVPQPSLLPAFR